MKLVVVISILSISCGSEKTNESTDAPDGTELTGDSSDSSADTRPGDGDTNFDGDSVGTGDTDVDGDGDVDTDGDADADSDSDGSFCPEGSREYTTSGGKIFCCPDTSPLFCDENDVGFEGGCWEAGVDCDTVVMCGGRAQACLIDYVSYCDADENFSCYLCPLGSAQYETTSGKPVCCSNDRPTFCDENSDGYSGGCWSDGVDCDTISTCGGSLTACYAGSLPYCDETGDFSCYPCPDGAVQYETTSGRPLCCGGDLPVFCDENTGGYTGGCWSDGVDCSTVLYCGGFWGACTTGRESSCEEDALRCLVP